MKTIDPGKSIVPIMKIGSDKKLNQLLGTGFFIGSLPTLVTAKHVFKITPLSEGEIYCIVLLHKNHQPQLWQINEIMYSDKYDIAAVYAKGISGVISLKLARTEWPSNLNVLTYDFSSTRITELHDGKRNIEFTPYTHKGNILCYYDSDYPETNLTRVFEVSFPVLQGASGAPVIRENDHAIVGMLIECRERDLTPAQIVTIKDNDKCTAEYKYFLPTGKAIASSVLIEYLSSIKCAADIVD